MATSEADNDLDQLYEKLDRFIKNDQHKKALKTAEDILVIAPKDEEATLVKISALMQLEQWDNAFATIQKTSLAPKLHFEKAYCLYKLDKIEEALSALGPLLSGADSERLIPALELAAQLHYRQGRSQQCIQIYDQLFQQHKVDSPELKTNILAAYVAAGLSRELPALMTAMKVSADKGFEVGYNKACGLVEEGQWAAAEIELRKALRKGRETLFEEGLEEDEVEEELAPLTVQLAYVLGRQGKQTEAQELYDVVLKRKSELHDQPTLAVAINNSFADSGRINAVPAHKKTVAGAAKKLEGLVEDPSKPGSLVLSRSLESRLSQSQKQLLGLNRALAYLLTNRTDQAKQLAAQLTKLEPVKQAPQLVPMLQAALLHKDGKLADADAVLQQFAASNPAAALEPLLARAQLAMEANDAAKAAAVLAEATANASQRQQPHGALVATQAALLTQLGDSAGAEALLSRTLAALKGSPGPALAWCLETLASLQLKLGKVQEAVSTYQQLQATGTQSATTAALLSRLMWVMASASSGGAAPAPLPAALTKGLPNMAAEVRGLNMDALESSVASSRAQAIPTSKITLAEQGMDIDGPPGAADAAKVQKHKKKTSGKKRKRYPKGYDPALPNGGLPPPDPERWLPKWQRTDAKKKKLKSSAREKGAVKGSQGAGKVDENLDRTKGEVKKVDTKAAASKPALPPPRKKK